MNQARITRGSAAFDICCAYFGLPAETSEEHTPSLSWTTVTAIYGLFPHQQRAALSACIALETGKHRVVLHMPTGAGKTRMTMHIVC